MKMSYLMMTLSIITPTLNHPISLGSILIIQTILLCLNMSLYSETSWYSYILFITMIGGMMIMFMYMASIASNEKFKMNKMMIPIMIITMLTLNFIEMKDYTMEYSNKLQENKMINFKSQELKTTMKMFNLNKSMITITMIITLLITMIAVTNISSTFEGPLKKTYV